MIDRQTEEKIQQMVRESKTIVDICEELGLEWRDVRKYLHSVDMRSWHGAKQVISLRLNSLVEENDEAARKTLMEDADKWVDYLHENG